MHAAAPVGLMIRMLAIARQLSGVLWSHGTAYWAGLAGGRALAAHGGRRRAVRADRAQQSWSCSDCVIAGLAGGRALAARGGRRRAVCADRAQQPQPGRPARHEGHAAAAAAARRGGRARPEGAPVLLSLLMRRTWLLSNPPQLVTQVMRRCPSLAAGGGQAGSVQQQLCCEVYVAFRKDQSMALLPYPNP